MNKNDIIELYNSSDKGTHTILSVDYDLDWDWGALFFVRNKDNACDDTWHEDEAIIKFILPAIRDTKQFQEGFRYWCDNINKISFEIECYHCDYMVTTSIYNLSKEFRLHYELDYIKQIFAEGVI
jgi:hypothetical protein